MKKISCLVLAMVVIFVTACKDPNEPENPQPQEEETETTEISPIAAIMGIATYMQTSLAFNSSVSEATAAASKIEGPLRIFAEETYPIVSWEPTDSTFWPVTVLVDYGTDPVAGSDGRMHQGELEVLTSGLYLDSATLLNVTHRGFYVDGIEISSDSETILNEGMTADGNSSFLVNILNGRLSNDSLDVIYEEETHREFVAGVNNGIIDTDITRHAYRVTGSQSGVIVPARACAVKDTLSYLLEIEEGMLVTVGKMFPTEGKLKVTVANMVPVDNFTLSFLGEDSTDPSKYNAEINYMGAVIPLILSRNGSYPDLSRIDLSGMTAADKAALLAILAQAGIGFFGN